MSQDYLSRITALEDELRQKNNQLSLVAETESFLRSALARAEEKIENEEREIEHLRAQIEKLRRMLFGTRSEKLRKQVEEAETLLRQQEQKSDRCHGRENDPQVPRQLRQSSHRRPLPEHLPRETNRLEPAETCCPECNSDLEYLSEVSAEQLELVSSALKVIRTVRVKKACVRCDCIVEAPAPSRPIDRGIAGPGLLARVLTGKYAEHSPLYRQTEIFARQGADLSRALLSNWVDACCRLMAPLDEALYHYVMDCRKLHTDDTPVPVLALGIYTTNAIDSLNSVIRAAIKKRKVFPTDDSVRKVIYLAIKDASKKWSMPIQNWRLAMSRFIIEFGDRLSDHL